MERNLVVVSRPSAIGFISYAKRQFTTLCCLSTACYISNRYRLFPIQGRDYSFHTKQKLVWLEFLAIDES